MGHQAARKTVMGKVSIEPSISPVKKVLIVSPHFCPVNAPDMQRVRLALPYFRGLGWEPVILAVHPDFVEGATLDQLLESTYPSDIRVIRSSGIPPRLTRRFKVGSIWLRCGKRYLAAARSVLAKEKFDLIFLSTTQFDFCRLGPLLKEEFGVPFVMDLQDPWISDYYETHGKTPPGGKFKYWVVQRAARKWEPRVIREASAVVSVSAKYGPELLARYPDTEASKYHHLPFGTSAADFEVAKGHCPKNPLINFDDGNIHFVYAGRCGPDMTMSLTLLFRAFREFVKEDPETGRRMRFHFIGTDYAPPPLGRFWALPIAEKEGVIEYVNEHCYRVPYFDALHYLINADGLLVMGSNDATYSASKIFPYLIAGRPLLVIVHQESLMLDLVRKVGITTAFGFGDETEGTISGKTHEIKQEWFMNEGYSRTECRDLKPMSPFGAERMAGTLVGIFNDSVNSGSLGRQTVY